MKAGGGQSKTCSGSTGVEDGHAHRWWRIAPFSGAACGDAFRSSSGLQTVGHDSFDRLFRVDLGAAFGVWMGVWGQRPNPPTVTGFRVPGLANPDFLIEIEAQAVLR